MQHVGTVAYRLLISNATKRCIYMHRGPNIRKKGVEMALVLAMVSPFHVGL